VLVNDQVIRQSILEGMKSFFAAAKADDTGVIALMGHGVIFDGVSYFLPYPADATNRNSEGLPASDFEAAVRSVSLKVQKVVLMLDTCHAEAFSPRARGLNRLTPSNKAARGINLVTEVSDKVPETSGSTRSDSLLLPNQANRSRSLPGTAFDIDRLVQLFDATLTDPSRRLSRARLS
jgi:hypothetical protein